MILVGLLLFFWQNECEFRFSELPQKEEDEANSKRPKVKVKKTQTKDKKKVDLENLKREVEMVKKLNSLEIIDFALMSDLVGRRKISEVWTVGVVPIDRSNNCDKALPPSDPPSLHLIRG